MGCCVEEFKPLNFKIEKVHSAFGVISIFFLDFLEDDGNEQTFVLGTLMPIVLNENEIDTNELFCDFKTMLRNYEKRFFARDEEMMGEISKKYFGLSDEVEVFGVFDTQSWKDSRNNIFIKDTKLLYERFQIIDVAHHVYKKMIIEYKM